METSELAVDGFMSAPLCFIAKNTYCQNNVEATFERLDWAPKSQHKPSCVHVFGQMTAEENHPQNSTIANASVSLRMRTWPVGEPRSPVGSALTHDTRFSASKPIGAKVFHKVCLLLV